MNNILGYSANENLYGTFAPKMSDGRIYSNSRQPIELDLILQGSNNNWDYRNYLMNNAESVMTLNRKHALNTNANYINLEARRGSYILDKPYTVNTKLEPNNLKANYLTCYELDSRLYAPEYPLELTQDNILVVPRSN